MSALTARNASAAAGIFLLREAAGRAPHAAPGPLARSTQRAGALPALPASTWNEPPRPALDCCVQLLRLTRPRPLFRGHQKGRGFACLLAWLHSAERRCWASVGLVREANCRRLTRPRPSRPDNTPKGPGLFSRSEDTCLAADTAGMAMSINRLPAGFVIPAQPSRAQGWAEPASA
jgi:hypothetical protein